MTGLIDIEFNTGGASGHEKNDLTMIEIAVQIADENNRYEVAEVYDVVVRPPKGRTILNGKIKELTSITQQEVDNGIDMCTVYSNIHRLYHKYNVKEIYTWGTCDEEVIRWNYEKYSIGTLTGIPSDEVCVPFTDLSTVLKDRYEGRHGISLINMAVLCECKPILQHRAFADAETMRNILICLSDSEDSDIKNRFRAYDVYSDLRDMYSQMKKIVSIAREYDIDTDALLETAKLGSDFPVFDDAYNDTYNKRIFGWL